MPSTLPNPKTDTADGATDATGDAESDGDGATGTGYKARGRKGAEREIKPHRGRAEKGQIRRTATGKWENFPNMRDG